MTPRPVPLVAAMWLAVSISSTAASATPPLSVQSPSVELPSVESPSVESLNVQSPTASAPAALVRVDSVGFVAGDSKRAYLMTDRPVSGESFVVRGAGGQAIFSGHVGTRSRGRWSAAYPDVYPLDFSGLHAPGRYVIAVSGAVHASSPSFAIEGSRALNLPIVENGVRFFQAQRDGSAQVSDQLHRKASHLHDARAGVYRLPHFAHPGHSDAIRGPLRRVRGRRVINAAGGWFDAGDFLKFTHTAAYADDLLFASARALGSAAPPALTAEARYGEAWLRKMWHQKSRTLYLQVGIGSGDRSGSYVGDHDLWRLPQADDRDRRQRDRSATSHRPVFEAAAPGHRISPNLAGRVSAAFALAAQADAARHHKRAISELSAAQSLFGQAATHHPPHPLVTAAPFEYYPEDSWHDDMALGGAEIALARLDLNRSAGRFIAESARWARAYITHDAGGDSFNLYDTSALAETDLVEAMRQVGTTRSFAVSKARLLGDVKRQLRRADRRSARDPFRAGGFYDEFDVDSHTFGLIATAAMFDKAAHRAAYQGFATAQRAWLFGANAWGASFMVGEGTNFPRCMQHQVANLSGRLDGTPPLLLGAVVNGPNGARIFSGGLGSRQEGMRRCPTNGIDPYRFFNGRGSRYVDDVRSWQTSEPAIDMTSTAVFAAALDAAR
jgi:endoglucanase